MSIIRSLKLKLRDTHPYLNLFPLYIYIIVNALLIFINILYINVLVNTTLRILFL